MVLLCSTFKGRWQPIFIGFYIYLFIGADIFIICNSYFYFGSINWRYESKFVYYAAPCMNGLLKLLCDLHYVSFEFSDL